VLCLPPVQVAQGGLAAIVGGIPSSLITGALSGGALYLHDILVAQDQVKAACE
jgi:hypothetical protein